MIAAIVLAAGASSRMGRPKAGLSLSSAGGTLIEHVIKTLTNGGLPRIVVVAGAHVEAVQSALSTARLAEVIVNEEWQRGQLSSLLAGLDAIDTPTLEAAMVTLVDVPLVTASTVATLVSEWRRTRAPIVRPAQGERHGHPVIFDRAVFADLRAADMNVGAKAVFAKHRPHVLDVPVEDPGAFEDIDTPEDYERLIALNRR